jgi:hypothetical protein
MMVRTRPRGPLDARGIQQVVRRLKTRVGIAGRCSPHSPRHNFARSYLVDGGDVFSLQRILGHTTLDMVRRYVALADVDLVARHAAASPHHSGTLQSLRRRRHAPCRQHPVTRGLEGRREGWPPDRRAAAVEAA